MIRRDFRKGVPFFVGKSEMKNGRKTVFISENFNIYKIIFKIRNNLKIKI